jgi:hypothetical protein
MSRVLAVGLLEIGVDGAAALLVALRFGGGQRLGEADLGGFGNLPLLQVAVGLVAVWARARLVERASRPAAVAKRLIMAGISLCGFDLGGSGLGTLKRRGSCGVSVFGKKRSA